MQALDPKPYTVRAGDTLTSIARQFGFLNWAEIYQNSQQMAQDYPWFGTGPGTFRSVYELYRAEPTERWHAFPNQRTQATSERR